ncbi:hypothetical protein GCM10022267_76440 [Lentzea roselyniae]|uniref:Uncharacterized protein n=1 Tax=Lentzea roselyniae TaxID=531940 RepID=A0ABP7C4T6_9PSEU
MPPAAIREIAAVSVVGSEIVPAAPSRPDGDTCRTLSAADAGNGNARTTAKATPTDFVFITVLPRCERAILGALSSKLTHPLSEPQ